MKSIFKEIRTLQKKLNAEELAFWLYCNELKEQGLSVMELPMQRVIDELKISKRMYYSVRSSLSEKGLI